METLCHSYYINNIQPPACCFIPQIEYFSDRHPAVERREHDKRNTSMKLKVDQHELHHPLRFMLNFQISQNPSKGTLLKKNDSVFVFVTKTDDKHDFILPDGHLLVGWNDERLTCSVHRRKTSSKAKT